MGKGLTKKETAKYLNVTIRTVNWLLERKELKKYKIGKFVLIDEDELNIYIRKQKEKYR
jgi:excisionase family DNA binding protein